MSEQQSFSLTSPMTMEGNRVAVGAGSTGVTHCLEGHLEPAHPQSTSRVEEQSRSHVNTTLRGNGYREDKVVLDLSVQFGKGGKKTKKPK